MDKLESQNPPENLAQVAKKYQRGSYNHIKYYLAL